jgi:hypothetical protein
MSGPQFYPHCFNIEIRGSGSQTPAGVKFPGGYEAKDPSLVFALYTRAGKENDWEAYKVPGPPKYAGKYDAPTGSAPVVSAKDRGIFPEAFQAKYDAFKRREDEEGMSFNKRLNDAQAALNHKKVDMANERLLMPIFREHITAQSRLDRELATLRNEAIKLGIAV